jgi:hypothetical protein
VIWHVLLLSGLAIAVSGCIPDQKSKAATCALDGIRQYPSDPNGNTGRRADYVRLCMAAAGYDFTPLLDDCPFTSEMASTWQCYSPSDPLARLGRKVEVMWSELLR